MHKHYVIVWNEWDRSLEEHLIGPFPTYAQAEEMADKFTTVQWEIVEMEDPRDVDLEG